jgi:hypothetical protein
VGELKPGWQTSGDEKASRMRSERREREGKNLITQRSKQASAVWRECREFMYVESSLRKKPFIDFLRNGFRARFFLTSSETTTTTRGKNFLWFLYREQG